MSSTLAASARVSLEVVVSAAIACTAWAACSATEPVHTEGSWLAATPDRSVVALAKEAAAFA